MPTAGGTPRQVTFFGYAATIVVGFAPDGRLLIASAGSAPFRSHSWSYAIDLSEGADPTPQLLPFGPVNGVAISSGPVVVGTGYLRDPAHWKRYRGGTAGQIWLLDEFNAASQPRQLEISLGSTRAGRQVRLVKAAEHLGHVSVDRTGRASAVEVRGNIVWLTHRNGPARTVAAADGVRHREPV